MKQLGFIGTGAITAAMVRGLKASPLAEWPIVVSPRSTAVSAELARTLPGVSIAADNQDVIGRSDIVVLAVRPQDAEAVIRPLTFPSEMPVISLVAALGIDTIRAWTGLKDVTRAIPLTFVEERRGVTPVIPPNAAAAEIFGALGGSIAVSDLDAFDAYAAASALMSTYFGIAEAAQAWLCANGLREEDSALYLRNLFGSLGDVFRAKPLPLAALREAHATRGGLNELAHLTFTGSGGNTAIADALTAVMARIRSQRAAAG